MPSEDTIYFFTGKNNFKKDSYIKKIKSKLSLPPHSLDYNVYYTKETPFDEVASMLKTPPFLNKRRLVILKDIEKLSSAEVGQLELYCRTPCKYSILVLAMNASPKRSDRLAVIAKEYTKYMNFPLVETDGINLKDSTFKLVDEIGFRRRKLALAQLLFLLDSGKDAHEILGLISWYMRRLGKVKTLFAKACGKNKIASQLKLNYNWAEKLIKQSQNFSLDEVKKAQSLILKADMGLKKSITKPAVILQILIMRLV